MYPTRKVGRHQHGLALTTLLTFIAAFIIAPLCMTVYEIVEYNLAQLQLKHCVDSAALAAGCAVTGSNTGNLTTTETNAMTQALKMFQQNTVLSYSLSTATDSWATAAGNVIPNTTVGAYKSALFFEFFDPTTMNQVGLGGANGKIIRVIGFFGFLPSFANFLHLNGAVYQVVAQSDGGLPQLDVVLCLDLSASMDDFTNVMLVNRGGPASSTVSSSSWSGGPIYSTAGYNVYQAIAQNYLYGAVQSTYVNGVSTNAAWPMLMDNCANCAITANPIGHGTHNGAKPPTNGNLTATTYTDIVVPLDGSINCAAAVTVNGTYQGKAYTYTFPSGPQGMAVLVEAARGNLESKTTAQAAGCYIDAQGRALGQPSGATGVTCQPGWFAAYYVTLYAVLEPAGAIQSLSLPGNSTFTLTSVSPSGHIPLRHPIGDGIAAAEDFFQILYNDADVHFGLVGFSDMVGSNNQSNHGPFFSLYQNVDVSPSTYPSDGLEPAVPYVPLSLTAGAAGSNYDTNIPPLAFPVNSVNDAIYNSIGNISNGSYAWTMPPYTVTAEGGTAIAAALNAAVDMILPTGKTAADGTPGLNLARPGATTAIVLFTDGLPNGGNDSGASDPDAQAAATTAGQNGIPIYTIGLSLIPGLEATQAQILTDTPGSSGIAALSGNGASFAQTTSATQLDAVFQSVARQLVQLVN